MWPKNAEKCKLRQFLKMKMRCPKSKKSDGVEAVYVVGVSDNMDQENLKLVFDEETGETPATPMINSETGEPEVNYMQPEIRRPFKIPSIYRTVSDDKMCLKNVEEIDIPKIYAKPEASKSPVLIFLLPTLFFFFPIVAVPLSIIELVLHTWAHKKNKELQNKDIYYQSPMHIYVSEFCAACRFEASKEKITKIQDIRNRRNGMIFNSGIECVRSIV